MLIPCPCCGPRDVAEFSYGGDATLTRPADGESDPAVWCRWVYLRANPRGAHLEYWQHTGGCRSWLKVRRDTLSHEVATAELVGPWAEAGALLDAE
jgi:heterotetrameric sarcosine oxidase delta subunit